MKKNVQAGLITSLLLAPGLVAHASETTEAPQVTIVANTTTEDPASLEVEQATETRQKFLDTYMTALVNETKATAFNADLYEDAVQNASNAYADLPADVKSITKDYKFDSGKGVLTLINEGVTNLSKALAVTTKVENIEATQFTTAAAFKKEMSAVQTSYNALTPLQKNLVTNWDNLADFNQVMTLIAKIKAITVGATGYREEVTAAEKDYETIGKIVNDGAKLQTFVDNYKDLQALRASISLAENVEKAIRAITIENASTQLTTANDAYKGLSTTDKKHVNSEDLTTLNTWLSASSKAAAVVKNINAIVVEKSDFVSKTNTALASWSNISSADGQLSTDQKLVTNSARLLTLAPYADVANKVTNLAISKSTFTEEFAAAKAAYTNWPTQTTGLTATDTAQLATLKTKLGEVLTALESEVTLASQIVKDIEALQANASAVDLEKLSELREQYTTLSTAAKTLVTNAKDLTALEQQYSAALNVVSAIKKLDFTASDFTRKVLDIQKAYDNIAPTSMKAAVSNYSVLEDYVPIAKVMQEINALKPSAKDFREKLSEARANYDAVAGTATAVEEPKTALEHLVKEYLPKLTSAEATLINSDRVIQAIIELKDSTGKAFMDKLTQVDDDYSALTSSEKRNVTNAKDLTALERDYRSALKVYNLIIKLPPTTDKGYPKKVVAAEKAYQKLADKQKGYVYNYADDLGARLKVADILGRIDKLKSGSKTFEEEVAAIRAAYEGLTTSEKDLIHNYDKLTQAELNMSDAEVVEKLIDVATPGTSDYLAKLTAAREAYNALDKTNRKLVSNIKDLTTRERAVKPILKLDSQIAALSPANAKQFVSKYKSAQKAYDKLEANDRALLSNEELLTKELKPLYDVINLIASIKSSSKTFVADTKKARDMYESLSGEQQSKISNIELLIDHELNVEGGAKVDALIIEMENSEPQERIAKVKAAREAYDALNTKNRKAVTRFNTLKDMEKYIKPVEQVIVLIDGISDPRNNLGKQVDKISKAMLKLDAEQTSYITNMEKYMDLSEVVKVYQLIEKLKPSDKYYLGNLQSAKAAYSKLSATEKHRVTNYSKLQEAELSVAEVQKVYNIISTLSSQSGTYIADIEAAEEAYKDLPSGLRNQVTNYDALKDAKKNIKSAQGVISKIDKIDPDARSFESKVISVIKAYEKLSDDQKKLVSNYNLLRSYERELGL